MKLWLKITSALGASLLIGIGAGAAYSHNSASNWKAECKATVDEYVIASNDVTTDLHRLTVLYNALDENPFASWAAFGEIIRIATSLDEKYENTSKLEDKVFETCYQPAHSENLKGLRKAWVQYAYDAYVSPTFAFAVDANNRREGAEKAFAAAALKAPQTNPIQTA